MNGRADKKLTHRSIDTHINEHTDRRIDKQSNKQTDSRIDKQSRVLNRQTDEQTKK
jgi:hypothetical protein